MPRTSPTTNWTPRTSPSTSWANPRESADVIAFDSTEITFDADVFTFDQTLTEVATTWDNPRYALYVEDLTLINVTDLLWADVTWVSWTETNILDTIWT